MKNTQRLELEHQRRELNRQVSELEYSLGKGEISKTQYDRKREEIIYGYKEIVSEILVG